MNIAKVIEHTILKPELPFGVYTEAVRNCVGYNFKSLVVNPQFVHLISNLLKNHPSCSTVPCSVVSFPFGSTLLTEKLVELNNAIFDGAKEVDFVINISAVKTGDWNKIKTEFRTLKEAANNQALLKCILEVGFLTDDEIKHCCDLAMENELDFVKTSTGFNVKLPIEKTAYYVKLMKDCVKGSPVRVKASGGIKTYCDLEMVLEAGADRVGTSNSMLILEEIFEKGDKK